MVPKSHPRIVLRGKLDSLLAIPGIKIKEVFPVEKVDDISALTRDLEKTCEKLKTIIKN